MTSDVPLRALGQARRRTMAVLVVAQVIGTVGVGIAPSIGVLLAEEVTADPALAGLARTASTLGAALSGLPLGALASRHGRRTALATGWLTAALGAALLVLAAQTRSAVVMFPGLMLIGAGLAVSLQSRFAATDLAAPQRRGRALALVVWVGTLGSVLGPNLGLPGAVLGRATGLTVFAGAFLIAAACLFVSGLVVLIALRPDPLRLAQQLGASTPTGRRGGLRRLLAELRVNRPARTAVLAIVTAQVVMVAVMTMTPVHIAHEGGSVAVVGFTISLHVAGMYALAPVVGLLGDRIGQRATIGIGIGILTTSLLLAAAAPAAGGAVVTSLILLGIGWSFINVAGSALFAGIIDDSSRALAQGGVDTLANLCGATAAFLAGPLMKATGFSTLALLALVALIPLLAVLLLARRARLLRPAA